MARKIELSEAYAEADEAARKYMREACRLIAKAEQAEKATPEQMLMAIEATAEELLHAQMHLDAMRSINTLILRGYESVTVARMQAHPDECKVVACHADRDPGSEYCWAHRIPIEEAQARQTQGG